MYSTKTLYVCILNKQCMCIYFLNEEDLFIYMRERVRKRDTKLNYLIVQFQIIQFSLSTQFRCHSSIWPIDRILSSATTLGQSGPGSDGNEGVCIH